MAPDVGSRDPLPHATEVMEVMRRRRSHRRYAPDPVPEVAIAYVLDCAERFQVRCGFTAPVLEVIPRGPEFDLVTRAAATGIVGLVNPWLPDTRASHLLLCSAVYPDDERHVPRAIEQAAMTMQVAVLAAAEAGLATCWMAGINHARIEGVHRLADGAVLIAMSPLGLPSTRAGLSWDGVARQVLSKRRKPLDALWSPEGWR